jgi:pimeloyl-ACP methyl ester carboxylesterase
VIELATDVGPDRVTIAYERLGDPGATPLVLIMGLNAQLIAWPDPFCVKLVAHGLHVIRFDNRDAGESTRLSDAPMPNFAAALAGDVSTAVYTLSNMAADTAGLLDALHLDSAHVVGASLGGYIAQTLAIEHPARVRSLTSIMASTGDRSVGQPHPESARLFAGVPPRTRDEAIARALLATEIVSSPGYPPDRDRIADRAGRAFDRGRGFDPAAMVRQAVASIASGDRTERLRGLDVPTLVIHGAADKLCDVSGGRATAAAIPGAELVVVDGMGHDLPEPLWQDFADRIAAVVARGEARRGAA